MLPQQRQAGVGGQQEAVLLDGANEAAMRTAAHRAMAVIAMKILPFIHLPFG